MSVFAPREYFDRLVDEAGEGKDALTLADCLEKWKNHPDVLRGRELMFEDWQVLIGEALVEGAHWEEIKPYTLAIKEHFGIEQTN